MNVNQVYDVACQRGIITYDIEAENGKLTKRLISLFKTINRRYSPAGSARLVTLCIGEDVEVSQELQETFPSLHFVKVKQLNEDGEFTLDFIKQFNMINKPRLVLGVMPPILGAY